MWPIKGCGPEGGHDETDVLKLCDQAEAVLHLDAVETPAVLKGVVEPLNILQGKIDSAKNTDSMAILLFPCGSLTSTVS